MSDFFEIDNEFWIRLCDIKMVTVALDEVWVQYANGQVRVSKAFTPRFLKAWKEHVKEKP